MRANHPLRRKMRVLGTLVLALGLSSCANPYVQAAAEGFLRGTLRPVTTCTTTYTSAHGRSGAYTSCHTY